MMHLSATCSDREKVGISDWIFEGMRSAVSGYLCLPLQPILIRNLIPHPMLTHQMLAVLGIDGVVMLSRTPVLPALALDTSPSYEVLWRSLAGSEAPSPSASVDRSGSGAAKASSEVAATAGLKSAVRKADGGKGGLRAAPSVSEDAGLQAIALRCLGHALFKANRFVGMHYKKCKQALNSKCNKKAGPAPAPIST